jgi:hypothetical protein
MSTKTIVAVFLAMALLGCAGASQKATLESENHGRSTPAAKTHLDPMKTVFVTVPDDGEVSDEIYLGSGQAVARAIAMAFIKQGIAAYVVGGQAITDDQLNAPAQARAGYVVRSIITLWEQRNGWLGWPSRLSIRMNIVDVGTGHVVESAPIETGNETLVAFTVTSPEMLLEKPLDAYVGKLY